SAGSYRLPALPASWESLRPQLEQPYFRELRAFLDAEARDHLIMPPADVVFRALELTSWRDVRVLLLGQDPYPTPGHAHGLCFSVRPGVKPPASLRNVYRELRGDVGIETPSHGSLVAWARAGMLLLNAVLTVRAGESNSHRGRGWESFTDEIIRRVNAKPDPVVFALWGAHAQKKSSLIDTTRHAIVTAAHPSPLSARRGFLGSRPFTRINEALIERGARPIHWRLPEVADEGQDAGGAAAARLT
ncbi:MAG TPA: uracil-DNA glycosylase, partial [Vicinamibacterales bacterium]|nr:uracil-DNA glycosylase [Vicinamibacterales bacterium]